LNTFYSSLELIPKKLLGKHNKFSILSLSQNQQIFEVIEKEVSKHFLNFKLEKDIQIKTFPIVKEIIFEFYKVIRSIIEIQTCNRMKVNVIFDEINSPIFSNLLKNSHLEDNYVKKNYHLSIKNKIKLFLKKIQTKVNIKKEFDLHNQSLLLNEFINEKNIEYNFLWPEIFLTSFKKSKLIKDFVDDKVTLILKYLFLKYEISQTYFRRAFLMLTSYVVKLYYLADNLYYSFSDINFIKLISDKLLGGTPQILGRVLNLVYISNEKQVIRFSHGGERVFFDDKLWVNTELINSTEYYTHGIPEKISVEKKIKKLPVELRKLMPSKIKTLGSRKHQIIYETSKGLNQKVKKKVILQSRR